MENVQHLRMKIRANEFTKPTTGYGMDRLQANVVILPKKYAYDFLLFCIRNPKPCPILEITDTGSPYIKKYSDDIIDIRTDVPKYRVFKNGEFVDEPLDIKDIWQDDFVTFLLGCSFTFENELINNGIPVKHINQGKNVAMYITNIETEPAGSFRGNQVVSMRPFHYSLIPRVVEITSRFPSAHGSPIHIGDPTQIGIKDIHSPDFGDSIDIAENEVPVFWACGVTPQVALLNSKPDITITHAPGHMLITDYPTAKLAR
ncbi:MAG: putative hydro-lyase [Tepidibacillus sp.]